MADSVRHMEPHVRTRNKLPLPRESPQPQYRPMGLIEGETSSTIANRTALQADLPERKPRKSVAFSEGATIVDSDGQVTESKEMNGGKSTAESHSGEPSPPTSQDAHVYTLGKHGLTRGVTDGADKDVEEVTDMFADLAKKVRKEREHLHQKQSLTRHRRRRSPQRRRKRARRTPEKTTSPRSRRRRSPARRRSRTTSKPSWPLLEARSLRARRRRPLLLSRRYKRAT